jgi:hypothetical protein
MPLFRSLDNGPGERDESQNVQSRSQESHLPYQHHHSYRREYNWDRPNDTKYIPDALIFPPPRHYPLPPYNYGHRRYAEDDYYHAEMYQKLPVRDILPAQRVPRYHPSHDYYQSFHHPVSYSREIEEQAHSLKEVHPPIEHSHDEIPPQKKAKLSENEDHSMIQDAELLATLFSSTEKQKHEKENTDVLRSIVPSEVDYQSPILTKEIASPISHPLSRNQEHSSEDARFKVESKSPRGSADSHVVAHHALHSTKPYYRPPFHAGIPPRRVSCALPPQPPIPFPLERKAIDYGPGPHPQYGKTFPLHPSLSQRPFCENHRPQIPYPDYYHHPYNYPPHSSRKTGETKKPLIILKRKCAWKNCPELEKFLIDNREEYLKHSAMNYTSEQKQYNNKLTERLLEEAKKHGYAFDLVDFNFVTIRDRIRCFYKSYVQNCKKKGILVGYDENGNKRASDQDSKADDDNDDINHKEEKIDDVEVDSPDPVS